MQSEIIIGECKKYSKGKLLGKGGFSTCYEFTDSKSNRIYAGKIIPKSALNDLKARRRLKNEIEIHRSLSHDRIVKFEDIFEDSTNVYMVLELCNGISLKKLVQQRGAILENDTRMFFREILEGVEYIHHHNIVHRDLTLGNVFLHNSHVKLGDFGLATKMGTNGNKEFTVCGTPNYIAPEILTYEGYNFGVDIWSLGVILYALLIGNPPFKTSSLELTCSRIKAGKWGFPGRPTVSEYARDLISWILRIEPSRRPTLSEIQAHPFCRVPIDANLVFF